MPSRFRFGCRRAAPVEANQNSPRSSTSQARSGRNSETKASSETPGSRCRGLFKKGAPCWLAARCDALAASPGRPGPAATWKPLLNQRYPCQCGELAPAIAPALRSFTPMASQKAQLALGAPRVYWLAVDLCRPSIASVPSCARFFKPQLAWGAELGPVQLIERLGGYGCSRQGLPFGSEPQGSLARIPEWP